MQNECIAAGTDLNRGCGRSDDTILFVPVEPMDLSKVWRDADRNQGCETVWTTRQNAIILCFVSQGCFLVVAVESRALCFSRKSSLLWAESCNANVKNRDVNVPSAWSRLTILRDECSLVLAFENPINHDNLLVMRSGRRFSGWYEPD